MHKIKNKKAQEEIFGFVIIVLIVIVIALVFFSFSLRRPKEIQEAKKAELDDLLYTTLSYTTYCSISGTQQNMRELIRQCKNNPSKKCDNDKNVCQELNTTLTTIFDKLFQNLTESYIRGYNITIDNMIITRGNLSGNYFSSRTFIPTLGGSDIEVKIRAYYQ